MARVILTADGQEFDIEDEIAGDDDLLKSVLKSSYPQLGDPELRRENKSGLLTVRVTKRAGPKGSAVLDELRDAPEAVNSGVSINRRLDEARDRARGPKVFVARVLKMEADVLASIHAAAADSKAVAESSASLRAGEGEAALYVPTGF